VKKYLLSIALFTPIILHAAPKHFDSVQNMMTDFNDYDPSAGDFAVLKDRPLTVTISPVIMPGENPVVVDQELEKASVYVAYRTFIHTDAKQISVTAFPRELNFQTHKSSFLKSKSIKFTITRDTALKNVQRFLEVNNLSELIGDNGTSFTTDFKNCCYLPEGNPGLKSFYATISKK